jgi:hypothetical protein
MLSKQTDFIAEEIGIPVSAAITCVKPSGTVSQLVDAASGIHARHNDYYIRTVRGDNKDPLTQFLIESGVHNERCVNEARHDDCLFVSNKGTRRCGHTNSNDSY